MMNLYYKTFKSRQYKNEPNIFAFVAKMSTLFSIQEIHPTAQINQSERLLANIHRVLPEFHGLQYSIVSTGYKHLAEKLCETKKSFLQALSQRSVVTCSQSS